MNSSGVVLTPVGIEFVVAVGQRPVGRSHLEELLREIDVIEGEGKAQVEAQGSRQAVEIERGLSACPYGESGDGSHARWGERRLEAGLGHHRVPDHVILIERHAQRAVDTQRCLERAEAATQLSTDSTGQGGREATLGHVVVIGDGLNVLRSKYDEQWLGPVRIGLPLRQHPPLEQLRGRSKGLGEQPWTVVVEEAARGVREEPALALGRGPAGQESGGVDDAIVHVGVDGVEGAEVDVELDRQIDVRETHCEQNEFGRPGGDGSSRGQEGIGVRHRPIDLAVHRLVLRLRQACRAGRLVAREDRALQRLGADFRITGHEREGDTDLDQGRQAQSANRRKEIPKEQRDLERLGTVVGSGAGGAPRAVRRVAASTGASLGSVHNDAGLQNEEVHRMAEEAEAVSDSLAEGGSRGILFNMGAPCGAVQTRTPLPYVLESEVVRVVVVLFRNGDEKERLPLAFEPSRPNGRVTREARRGIAYVDFKILSRDLEEFLQSGQGGIDTAGIEVFQMVVRQRKHGLHIAWEGVGCGGLEHRELGPSRRPLGLIEQFFPETFVARQKRPRREVGTPAETPLMRKQRAHEPSKVHCRGP